MDTDLPSVEMKDIPLRAPAGVNVISPITDLVVAKMMSTANTESKLSREDAEIAVMNLFSDNNLTSETLYSNYIVNKKSSDLATAQFAKKKHKTAQILVETKANASSDEAFDNAIEDILSLVIEQVDGMTDTELKTNTYRPYVDISEDDSPKLIINHSAIFITQQMEELDLKLSTIEDNYGNVALWKDISIEHSMTDLVKDEDSNNDNILSVANSDELKDDNLKVLLHDNGLTISRIEATKVVMEGQYEIILATTDVNNIGELAPSLKSSYKLKFKIKTDDDSNNTLPTRPESPVTLTPEVDPIRPENPRIRER